MRPHAALLTKGRLKFFKHPIHGDDARPLNWVYRLAACSEILERAGVDMASHKFSKSGRKYEAAVKQFGPSKKWIGMSPLRYRNPGTASAPAAAAE